jgi:hypothetical protein
LQHQVITFYPQGQSSKLQLKFFFLPGLKQSQRANFYKSIHHSPSPPSAELLWSTFLSLFEFISQEPNSLPLSFYYLPLIFRAFQ